MTVRNDTHNTCLTFSWDEAGLIKPLPFHLQIETVCLPPWALSPPNDAWVVLLLLYLLSPLASYLNYNLLIPNTIFLFCASAITEVVVLHWDFYIDRSNKEE